jgi:AcrR family transcriptional regulator
MLMVRGKPNPKPSTHDRVLDAAERLLARGRAAFSMRELADEAALSFATPFNQFGNKAAIMLALSSRRIAAMQERITNADLPEQASARVLAAVDVAVEVMLATPSVSRAVMGAIGAPAEERGQVLVRSSAFWAQALGPGVELARATRSVALETLPRQLAIAFRGVLSFWSGGEFDDQLLSVRARAAAATVLFGFLEPGGRAALLEIIRLAQSANRESERE